MYILLLGIVTGLDNFMVSAGLGKHDLSRLHRAGLVTGFAICEAFMPILGYSLFGGISGDTVDWLVPVLIVLTGLLVLFGVFDRGMLGNVGRSRHLALVLVLPILLSFDNLAAGGAIGLGGGYNLGAAVLAGVIAAIISVAGLAVGATVLNRVALRPQVVLACCLFVAATLEMVEMV